MTSASNRPCSFSELRLQAANNKPIKPSGKYVLYWMTAARRSHWNYALQRAAETARELGVGLLIFEPLRCDYPHASDRLHRFALEGMRDNRSALAGKPVCYYPWVESAPEQYLGLLASLAAEASLVVTDYFPIAFSRNMVASAAEQLDVRLETVDGNGLLPLYLTEREYTTAYSFRRLLHKALPAFIDDPPLADPLNGLQLPSVTVAGRITDHWPIANPAEWLKPNGLARLPIDHRVTPAPISGGPVRGSERLTDFFAEDLTGYAGQRNIPDLDRTSQLSTYLHFGHISCHQVFSQLAEQERWDSSRLALKPTGQRSGWWGMSESAEAFLDELVTWRELGFVFCHHRSDYADYAGLPEWARISLEKHRTDLRPYLYGIEDLETARTHDPLWNAAQRQLLQEGRMHGYLRMLWGKKILEWSPEPETAMQRMLELNDRYALDGSDPNSCSGISWCLGRFDRAWGPERPIFGKIRYMTSENTARKVAVKNYLKRYAAESP